MCVSHDSICWSALDPPVFRGNRCRRVLTPLADNYTRLFLAGCRIRRLQECAKVERPHAGGYQNLPTGGHGDGTAVITESEQIPRSQRCWVRAERCSYVCQGGRMTFRLPHFWGLRVVSRTGLLLVCGQDR